MASDETSRLTFGNDRAQADANFNETNYANPNFRPEFMGDLQGHQGVGKYTVPLKNMQGENADEDANPKACKFSYDPNHTLPNLLHWKGTVLPGLVTRPIVWLAIILYTFGSICNRGFHEECGQYLPVIQMAEIEMTGKLLMFFLAFYSSQCYARFQKQYTNLKNIEGQIRSIAIQMRHWYQMPGQHDVHTTYKMIELFRYLGGSYYLMFARLYDGTERTFNLSCAYEEGLVTLEEKEALKNSSPSMQWFRMLCWAFHTVQEMQESGHLSAAHGGAIEGSLLGVRAAMNNVTYEYQMPIPLAYYHIITLLCISFVMIYAWTAALLTESICIAWIPFIMPVFGFCGMREVAIQMAEPFGDDDTDLPVDVYVHNLMHFLVEFIEEPWRPHAAIDGQHFHDGQHLVQRRTKMPQHQVQAVIQRGADDAQRQTPASNQLSHAEHRAGGGPIHGFLGLQPGRDFASGYQSGAAAEVGGARGWDSTGFLGVGN